MTVRTQVRAGRPGRKAAAWCLAGLMLAGAWFRTAGLYRGLPDGVLFHPDTPKQVLMLSNFLEGRAVQYHGSLFYDGYPYGLNWLDSLLLRPLQSVSESVARWMLPDAPEPRWREPAALYYWARPLRVAYGLAVIPLLYLAARRLRFSRAAALVAAGLAALAPLGSAVTYCVAGDVGVDVFLTLSLLCMARFATARKLHWLGWAGVACGMAFACKYQGALGLWLLAAPLALLGLGRRLAPRTVVLGGLLGGAGFAAGVVLLTPAFWVDPSRTLKLMRANFVFIRDYGVPRAFLELPWTERLAFALRTNVPRVGFSLGWALTALAVAAALLQAAAALRAVRRMRQPAGAPATPGDDSAFRRCAVLTGAATFPLLAGLMSLALKPRVQPFHFSYLVPFMALGAAGLLAQYRLQARSSAAGWALRCALAVAAVESIRGSLHEHYFWRREDTNVTARRFAYGVFEAPHSLTHRYRHAEALKHFFAEPSVRPVFRNRPAGMHHPETGWWREQRQLPVPSVPLPTPSEWVFMNGPVFPRNDRALRLSAATERRWMRRTLVFEQVPETLELGLRTGSRPARYSLNLGGRRVRGFLEPHAQRVVEVPSPRPRHVANDEGRGAAHVPFRGRSDLGPLWVHLIESPAERAVFETFGPGGGEGRPPGAFPSLDASTLAQRLHEFRYLDGDALRPSPERVLQPLPAGRALRLLPRDAALAAGAYRLELEVLNRATQPVRLQAAWRDDCQSLHTPPTETWDVLPGLQALSWTVAKPYVPFEADLSLLASEDGLLVKRWSLKPCAERMASWTPADSVAEQPPIESKTGWRALDVEHPRVGRWRGLVLPEHVRPGETFRYTVRFELNEGLDASVFEEAVLFLHLQDADGQVALHLDFLLSGAALGASPIPWRRVTAPADLAPGRYELRAGLYNVRTRRRFAVRAASTLDADRRRRTFLAAALDVLPGPAETAGEATEPAPGEGS